MKRWIATVAVLLAVLARLPALAFADPRDHDPRAVQPRNNAFSYPYPYPFGPPVGSSLVFDPARRQFYNAYTQPFTAPSVSPFVSAPSPFVPAPSRWAWAPGNWYWNGMGWAWTPGRWVLEVQPGF
jgi:hypothetical protein